MKYYLIIFMFSFSSIYSQKIQGKAEYKSKINMNVTVDDSSVNKDEQKKINEMFKKQFEKQFILIFKNNESVYREQEVLTSPNQTHNIEAILSNNNGNVLYRNYSENRYVFKNEFFGKLFLIKDSIKKLDWNLVNETKKIGEFLCYKATKIKRVDPTIKNHNSPNEDNKLKNDEQIITVWYTPQIPLSIGPESYYGLPGLILEVHDGNKVLVCDNIVLNSENNFKIKEPKSGKRVSQREFDIIKGKKLKEFEKRTKNTGINSKNSINISIK